MNVKLLIDGIMRQTMVLIAQLSTASGSRSPLSGVTDEVFCNLAREIEAQGVRKQVVADMFGLALRSYQKKMQRLTESATQRNRTLWEAVLEFVSSHEPTRSRVLERFARDGEREVVSVLTDLVRSGLVFTTGSGKNAIYGATSGDTRRAVQREHDQDSLENWIWLMVFRKEIESRQDAHGALNAEEPLIDAAIESLVRSGRLHWDGEKLCSSNLVVPVGSEQGWETAVLDHFRTVAVAIAKKVRDGEVASDTKDEVGGATFTFTVEAGHPYEAEVRGLLKSSRERYQAMWEKVSKYNDEHPPNLQVASRVTFYLGQLVEALEEPMVDSSEPPESQQEQQAQ